MIELKDFYNKFTNKKLKKIVNVYQLEYTNTKSKGLGDFLRGSFCFLQISKILNLDFEIDVSNHPISKYIENNNSVTNIDYNKITHYTELNRKTRHLNNYEDKPININKDFLNNTIELLNSKDCEIFSFYSTAFPMFNKHTTDGRQIINSKLQPNTLMQTYINNTLKELQLKKKGYGVIHIRTGDNYLVNGEKMSSDFINKIKKIIVKFIIPGRRYLILSDSNVLKSSLKQFPNCYILIRDIEHLGGEAMKSSETNGVMNTMLEYYLMSYSNAIVSLTVYSHVSGFSKYCSILNNIPFNSIKI
jgi:hypothetical protein